MSRKMTVAYRRTAGVSRPSSSPRSARPRLSGKCQFQYLSTVDLYWRKSQAWRYGIKSNAPGHFSTSLSVEWYFKRLMWLRMEKERINTLPIHLYSGKILTCFSFAPFTFSVSGWLLILSECLWQMSLTLIKQSLCKPVYYTCIC